MFVFSATTINRYVSGLDVSSHSLQNHGKECDLMGVRLISGLLSAIELYFCVEVATAEVCCYLLCRRPL